MNNKALGGRKHDTLQGTQLAFAWRKERNHENQHIGQSKFKLNTSGI